MTLLRESNAGRRPTSSSTDTTTTTNGKKDVDSSSRVEPPGTSKKNATTMSAAEKVRVVLETQMSLVFTPLCIFENFPLRACLRECI